MTKLATICMTSTNDKAANIKTAFRLLDEAARNDADWILLPEIFSYHGDYEHLFKNSEPEAGPLNQRLSEFAHKNNIILFAGTVGERPNESQTEHLINDDGHKKVFNTMYVFDRTGKIISRYRKTHLFNLLDDHGKPIYCEGDGFIHGDKLEIIEVDGLKVGLAICYDIRFPGFFTKLTKEHPIDVLVVPAAFTQKTGKDHWELLLRARAVEQQCYVFASNQTGLHGVGKISFGHSMIIDPWGKKLADTDAKEGIAYAEFNPGRLKAVRARLPALANRRPETLLEIKINQEF